MVKLNAKGQVVIPKPLRDKYGFKPGQEVEFREENGRLVLVKKGVRERIEKAGEEFEFSFPEGIDDSDEFIEALRGR